MASPAACHVASAAVVTAATAGQHTSQPSLRRLPLSPSAFTIAFSIGTTSSRAPPRPRRLLLPSPTRCAAGGDKPPQSQQGVAAKEEKGKEEEKVPSWAQPGTSEPPPWASEAKAKAAADQPAKPFKLPFGLYLLFSLFTAIAAVGSIFEYSEKNPVFGVIPPESPFWAPILLFFATTGFPTAGFLLFKAIQGFNEFADEADREDGV